MSASPDEPRGVARRLAAAFVTSKLTPLLVLVSLALGVLALASTPQEQDPTIFVPAIQVTAVWPGHDASEIDERVGRSLSVWIREIASVEHVSSASVDDAVVATAAFLAGVSDEAALTQLNGRLASHASELPPGVMLSTSLRGSDDAAVLSIAFWSDDDDARQLRRVAREIGRGIEQEPNVASTEIKGGVKRELSVRLDPVRLAAHGVTADHVVGALRGAGAAFPVGSVSGARGALSVRAGAVVHSALEMRQLVVGTHAAEIVRVADVADVDDGAEEPTSYVSFASRDTGGGARNAVVLSVRKVRGSNATDLTRRVRASLASGSAHDLLSSGVHYEITKDDGEAAAEKVQTLLEHMLIATAVVMLLVGVGLGVRAALIVGIVIPVTLAFVPFVYKLAGFTLNRITLAAMIFSIGILVDDAIVIVENVHRHYVDAAGRPKTDWARVTLDAVQEVGSPTILATMTVIAALAPTAFASGMMGQFIRALPIGASVGMLFSLFIALTLTPYLAFQLLRPRGAGSAGGHAHLGVPAWQRAYTASLRFVLGSGRRSALLMMLAVLGLAGVVGLFARRIVIFKNMPSSNVDAMAVVIDLPAETPLETTHRVASDVTRALLKNPEIAAVEAFTGVGGPLDFQGLARGYDLRRGGHQAELRIQLVRGHRATSHEIAASVRDIAGPLVAGSGGRLTVAEEPLGPPTQAAVVAEVYAPTPEQRLAIATEVRSTFARDPSLVDIDWSLTPSRPTLLVANDLERLTENGLVSGQAVASLRSILVGDVAMELSMQGEPEAVSVSVTTPRATRVSAEDVTARTVLNARGQPILVGDFSRPATNPGHATLLRKDLVPVIYVTAEVAGDASSLYSMLDGSRAFARSPALAGVEVLWSDRLPTSPQGTVRWGGEWTPTYELNRDLGLAFLVVLFIIYVMLAAWYSSYLTPIVVMLPIPLVMVGVVPAHLLAGKPMSAMGTIGIIALAGLMVRNSILIVDFVREKLERGASLQEAVVLAGNERVRPILLTAATVVFGDGVLYFDPLLQGLGLTMASGALVSTVLTVFVVPVAYFWFHRLAHRGAPEAAATREAEPSAAAWHD